MSEEAARREVLDRLEPGGGRVLEVSIGPGVNLPYLIGRPDVSEVHGLDRAAVTADGRALHSAGGDLPAAVMTRFSPRKAGEVRRWSITNLGRSTCSLRSSHNNQPTFEGRQAKSAPQVRSS